MNHKKLAQNLLHTEYKNLLQLETYNLDKPI